MEERERKRRWKGGGGRGKEERGDLGESQGPAPAPEAVRMDEETSLDFRPLHHRPLSNGHPASRPAGGATARSPQDRPSITAISARSVQTGRETEARERETDRQRQRETETERDVHAAVGCKGTQPVNPGVEIEPTVK